MQYSSFVCLVLAPELDSAWADATVHEAVAKGNEDASVVGSVANVVVALEEHVVEVDHLRQHVRLLLRAHVLGGEPDIEQIAVREKLSDALSHLLGLELGDGRKVSEIGRVELGRVVFHFGADRADAKDGIKTELAASSGAAGTPRRCKEFRGPLWIVGVGTVHQLHDGLEAATAGRLDGFSQKVLALPLSFLVSGLAAEISGVEGSGLTASFAHGKASDAGLGAASRETAIASLPFKGHKGRPAWFVGPVDLLSGLEFGGILAYVVKLDKDRVPGCAATAGQGVGFLFDDLSNTMQHNAIESSETIRIERAEDCYL